MDTNVAFEGKKYRVNGIDMHVVIQGQGPDVMLASRLDTRCPAR